MAKKNPYEEYENFSTRLRVETTYAEGDVRDHRDGFIQREYRRNLQDDSDRKQPMAGFPPMESVTQPSKPKGGVKQKRSTAKQDKELQDAVDKDISKRNVRRRNSK